LTIAEIGEMNEDLPTGHGARRVFSQLVLDLAAARETRKGRSGHALRSTSQGDRSLLLPRTGGRDEGGGAARKNFRSASDVARSRSSADAG
jgi:hypothetical protein